MKHDPNEILSAVGNSQATSAARAYKTLLVPVDARKRSARSVEVACRLAARFDAHVIGLYVQPTSYIPPELYASGSTASLAQIEEKMHEIAQAARATFDSASSTSPGCSLEWRTCQGDVAAVVMTHARYADLVIINQTDPGAEGASYVADTLMLSVGRPVLLVPYTGNLDSIGNRILVCWNASHEAARAITDALPLLQTATKVTVLSIDARASETGHGEQPGADMALFLARHGVKADVMQTVSGGLDEGNVILSRAADEGTDLIVMGAYGHPRLRETILGGATRTILQSMTVPVLMSH
jgi:nucleotide-binding universal stress UspA family protein